MLYWGQLLLQLSQDIISTNSKKKSSQHNNKKVRLYQQKKQPFLFINYQQNQRNHHVCISFQRPADSGFIFIMCIIYQRPADTGFIFIIYIIYQRPADSGRGARDRPSSQTSSVQPED